MSGCLAISVPAIIGTGTPYYRSRYCYYTVPVAQLLCTFLVNSYTCTCLLQSLTRVCIGVCGTRVAVVFQLLLLGLLASLSSRGPPLAYKQCTYEF